MGVGFVSSRTLATDRDWLFGLSVVVVEGSLSFTTFTSTFHRPFSVQKFVVLCRYLYIDPSFSPYCSRALRSSFFVSDAADPRGNLSPPVRRPQLCPPLLRSIYSSLETCDFDHITPN